MRRALVLALTMLSFLLTGPAPRAAAETGSEHTMTAEKFCHALYVCEPDVVAELAADSIVISYPIFATVIGAPALHGRDAAVEFARRFCSRWANADITFHKTIAEGNSVVLVWSFSARSIAPGPNGEPPSNEVQSWGGITLYQFNDDGKIVLEIGEESDPGPFARISPAND